MRKFLLAIVWIFGCIVLSAQVNQSNDPFYTSENIPSSPEAASLGEFGTISASPYNGKANVACLLYTSDAADD